MDVGAGEGVAFFGEAFDGFAGDAEVEQFEPPVGEVGDEVGVEVVDIFAAVGDAVAEEENAADAGEDGRLCSGAVAGAPVAAGSARALEKRDRTQSVTMDGRDRSDMGFGSFAGPRACR